MVLFFSLAILVNAGLLFLIQPLLAKMLLPWLGGSPAVWNTSLVFYQTCLLAGYGYSHFGPAWLGTRRHALIHLILMVAALFLLPISLPVQWLAAQTENPVGLLLTVLTLTIGFPFFVLSAGAPLIQKWFALCRHSAARDPYFLYAASNTGSIVGLLVYPLIMERWFLLSQQSHLWFYGYLGLVGFISACVVLLFRSPEKGEEPLVQQSVEQDSPGFAQPEITLARRWRWIVWSFVPSSLLLGVTSYLTTDIVSIPLLWVVPLAAYLLSFVIAFSRPAWATSPFLVRRQAFLLVGSAITVFMHANEPIWILVPLHLLAFFITAVICHGQLAADRPAASKLTDYYFWISLGGVLGGVFNALIAPVIFNVVLEYPLAIAAAAFLRPKVGEKTETIMQRRLDRILPLGLVVVVVLISVGIKQHQIRSPINETWLLWAISGVICTSFARRPVRFGFGLVVLTLISLWLPSPLGRTLYANRSFFGAYRVTLDSKSNRHLLLDGTTIHGAQSIAPSMRLIPMTYYHRTGPAGQVLIEERQARPFGRIAVVGLGSGALACHGGPTQNFTFYEIDPLVLKIARNEKMFTYLRDCPPHTDVVIGDARITLANASDHRYDVLVLDAFNSDVIPTHLLTREAFMLYLAKTAEDGFILFHISNRYFDLAPVLGRIALNLHLVALIQNDFKIGPQEQEEGKTSSRWVLLSRGETPVAPFLKDTRWQRLNGNLQDDLWTDEFSNPLKLISWH